MSSIWSLKKLELLIISAFQKPIEELLWLVVISSS